MTTAEARATRRLLLSATISSGASQLGGHIDSVGGELSTILSQGHVVVGERPQQSLFLRLKLLVDPVEPDDDPAELNAVS